MENEYTGENPKDLSPELVVSFLSEVPLLLLGSSSG